MSKSVTPKMGYMASDILDSGQLGFEGLDRNKKKMAIAACIRDAVNEDVCLTISQGTVLLEAISEVAENATEDGGSASKRVISLDLKAIYPIIQMVNGFHLDCVNCLNGECEHRDPDYPVTDI